ncbi:hypothetical protein [Arthrobacter sp. UYCu723]
MALVPVRDKETGEERIVSEAWLTRWPDDFEPSDSPQETPTPATGTNKKEKV